MIFGVGGGIEPKMCVLIFSTNFVWNIFHSMKNWKSYHHKSTWLCMYSARCSSHILMILKNIEMSNFMDVRPVGAEVFHADGRTDRYDEAIGRFLRFAKRA